MTRNATATFAAAVLATSALDQGLNAAGLRRLPRTAAVPGSSAEPSSRCSMCPWSCISRESITSSVTSLVQMKADSDHSSMLLGTPWSGTPFRLEALDRESSTNSSGSQGGGVEDLRSPEETRARRGCGAWRESPPGHALATIAAALDFPDLRSLEIWHPTTSIRHVPAAGRRTATRRNSSRILVEHRALGTSSDFDIVRRQVRARSTVNFADFALWTLAYGVVRDYLWKGEDGVRVTVAPARSPSASSHPSVTSGRP